MEALAPPLNCVLEMRVFLGQGLGVGSSLLRYIQRNDDSFSQQVAEWLRLREQGGQAHEYRHSLRSIYRKTLLSIFDMGLEGAPILEHMKKMENELMKVGQSELDEYIRRLPLISLLPLLFLQLPALLIIVLYPMLNELLKGLAS